MNSLRVFASANKDEAPVAGDYRELAAELTQRISGEVRFDIADGKAFTDAVPVIT